MEDSSYRNKRCEIGMMTKESSEYKPKMQEDTENEPEQDTVIWEEPGGLWRLFSAWTWCWPFFFCPLVDDDGKTPCDSATPSVTTHSESGDDDENKEQHALTTIDNVVPVIRQPPPVQVQTTWSSEPLDHPSIVYIYNLPKNRPSVVELSDRLTSIDTLTVSGDEAESDEEDIPPPPSRHIYRDAPPRPPLHATSSNNVPRPALAQSRTLTFGSATTQSSRHRRLRQTVSPADLKSVYEYEDDDTLSEASPFPDLDCGESSDSGVVPQQTPKSKSRRLSPPPGLVNAHSETTLEEDEVWMENWMQAWVTGAPGVCQEEARDDVYEPPQEIHVPCNQQVESTYLPRCPRLEHTFLSAGSKVLFAGWVVYVPSDTAIPTLPSRHDVVYLMLLEDVPKIYLARDDADQMTALDVTPKMRVAIHDISKSHGRGVTITNDGVHTGTLLPISLPSSMFHNQSLVPEQEFDKLAHHTIAPFRRTSKRGNNWHHSEYHQEYAPTAQLEAAMHLLFVMDSWMTKMLR